MEREWKKQYRDPDGVFFAARARKQEIREQESATRLGTPEVSAQETLKLLDYKLFWELTYYSRLD